MVIELSCNFSVDLRFFNIKFGEKEESQIFLPICSEIRGKETLGEGKHIL